MLIAKPQIFFLVTSLTFGLIFVFINPPGFGLDERAHFLRAYDISQGRLFTTTVDGHLGTETPKNLAYLVDTSTSDLNDSPRSSSVFGRQDAEMHRYRSLLHQPLSALKVEDRESDNQLAATFTYSPLGYFHMAAAMKLGELLHFSVLSLLYLVRVVNLALYVGVVFAAIKIAPRYKWLIAAIALLPTALFQASAVSVDSVVNGSAFLLTAILVHYWFERPENNKFPSLKLLLVFLLAELVLAKQPYVILVLPFLLLKTSAFSSMKSAIFWKVAWTLLALAVTLLWKHYSDQLLSNVVSTLNVGNYYAQLRFVISHPLQFIVTTVRTYYQMASVFFLGATGVIGDRQVGLSAFLVSVFFILQAYLPGLFEKSEVDDSVSAGLWYPRTTLLATGLLVMAGISLGLYLIYTPVGAPIIGGIQGRYFLPILPMLIISAADMTPLTTTNALLAKKITMVTTYCFLVLTVAVYFLVNY